MAQEKGVTRYHPLVVAMHWLVAVLVAGNLAAGALLLEPLSNADPAKTEVLRLHMASGLAILVLMALRILARAFTKAPASPHEKGALRWVARLNHWALYLVVIAMLSTGLGMAQMGELFPLLEGAPVSLPESFESLPPYAGHVLFSSVLLALVALHVAAVVYHHAKGEKLLSRMWFGRRDERDGVGLRAPAKSGS
ncbi:MAG: cytochrome b/b6 domain-containing protein [Erythrobacter sp.]|jgi:cytochrome b561|nr:cytochrome b/b6 domain-containing protein [Erythrobacter sp.]